MHDCNTILEDPLDEELTVTFAPPLHQQRRMWILDTLRKEGVVKVLDVGCGEGQLLGALAQPASWLLPPPSSTLPLPPPSEEPQFDATRDPIPNLHTVSIVGLDISENDLAYAVRCITPDANLNVPPPSDDNPSARRYTPTSFRWENMSAKLWKGGLEVINEDFIGTECIISSEVVEHLSPTLFPFFTPMLLGVYHPELLIMTTPSYTFNARFTAPDAPMSARKGFLDPTGRTDRILRHDDHKFEWTQDEFYTWARESAKEWGYEVDAKDIGRPIEPDPYGRDAQLGGASFFAVFRKRSDHTDDEEREKRGREAVATLREANNNTMVEHTLYAERDHPSHPQSQQPVSLAEIGAAVKSIMEDYRLASMRLEEIWFENDIGVQCGGWIEFLVRAVEEDEALSIRMEKNEEMFVSETWIVDLVNGVAVPLWPTPDHLEDGWAPIEEPYSAPNSEDEDDDTSGDADISWNEDADTSQELEPSTWTWGTVPLTIGTWGDDSDGEPLGTGSTVWATDDAAKSAMSWASSENSSNGWDGESSEYTTS